MAYLFYPRFIAFTLALTNAVESIYNCIENNFKEKHQDVPSIMKFINKVPVTYLMFVICAGLNIQLRILHPSSVNKYTHRILSVLTNGKGDRVAGNLVGVMMGFE